MFLARLKEDIDTIMTRDPAARSRWEVVFCYPGVHAMLAYRISNWLWRREWPFAARLTSHIAKVFTGIEIHPGATIGRRVFIDHGTGVVIGETAEIGDDVTLYHGVTLGGISLERGKRHPTLHDGVIIGAGAHVLGPITVGAGARVGANAVVVGDVPPGVTMIGIPAKAVLRKERNQAEEFCAYGVPREELPDPVARAIDALQDQVRTLAGRVAAVEAGAQEPAPAQAAPGDGAGPDASSPDVPSPDAPRLDERAAG